MKNSRLSPFVPSAGPVTNLALCPDAIFVLDERVDADGGFPRESFALLAKAGLLIAPFPTAMGGVGLGVHPDTIEHLCATLTMLGKSSRHLLSLPPRAATAAFRASSCRTRSTECCEISKPICASRF